MPAGPKNELSRPALAGRDLRGRAFLIAALVLLAGASIYLVVSKRLDIWRSAHASVHGLALGLEAASSALLDQPLASLRGMQADVARTGTSEAEVLAVLRNASRFDPASAYLGVMRAPSEQAIAVTSAGAIVSPATAVRLAKLIVPPTGIAPGVQQLIQLPDAEEWYLPITLTLPDGDGRNFAFALVPAHRLAETADSLLTIKGGYLAMATTDGRRLMRYSKAIGNLEVNGPPLLQSSVELAASKRSGSAELYSPPTSRWVVAGWARSRALPLYVSAAVPSTFLQAQWLAEAALPAAALVLGLAGAAVFGWQLRKALRANRAYVEKLQYAADHDSLTGLLNRDAFSRAAQRSIETQPEKGFAVMLMDISGFKDINDTLGHEVGDAVLKAAGTRIRDKFTPLGCTVARLGGDEIGLLAPVDDAPGNLERFCAELQACLAEPTSVNGVQLELAANVGSSGYPSDGRTPVELLRCADIAMYNAKANLHTFSKYTEAMDHFTADMLAMKAEFSKALRDGELGIVYQPKVSLSDGTLVGVEALSRWVQPGKGPVSPARFVPMAESSELIHPFTQYVLTKALSQAKAWFDAGHRVPVSVNVSTNNLLDPTFLDKVSASLASAGLPAAMLELELTESAVMRQPELVLRRLHALRDLGIVLSVDDFGTGFASMTYLKQLPVQVLKIDKSFVGNLVTDTADQHIVRSSVQLGHEFGMLVVAEGVETAEVADLLRTYGCDCAQGYFFDRPLAAEDVAAKWLVPQTAY